MSTLQSYSYLSKMSALKWSDLEALGWTMNRYDAHTRRYSYKTPVRSGKTKTINSKSDLDPCDAKYAHILYPTISGKAGGKMRHSAEQDGGGGQQVQKQDGPTGMDVEEGAGLKEVEQGATGLLAAGMARPGLPPPAAVLGQPGDWCPPRPPLHFIR